MQSSKLTKLSNFRYFFWACFPKMTIGSNVAFDTLETILIFAVGTYNCVNNVRLSNLFSEWNKLEDFAIVLLHFSSKAYKRFLFTSFFFSRSKWRKDSYRVIECECVPFSKQFWSCHHDREENNFSRLHRSIVLQKIVPVLT